MIYHSNRNQERLHSVQEAQDYEKKIRHKARMTQRRSNLLFIIYSCCVLLCIAVSPSFAAIAEPNERTARKMSQARMISQADLEQCEDNLGEADIDNDDALDIKEFLSFLNVISGGQYAPAKHTDIDLSLLNKFLTQACLCEEKPGAATDCCRTPKVDIIPGDAQEAGVLLKFCEDVAEFVSPHTMVQLDFNIQYSIKNDDGFNSVQLMNERGNTGKSDLISATRTVLINYLNSTYSTTNSRRRMVENNPADEYNELDDFDEAFDGQKISNIHVLNLSPDHIHTLRELSQTAEEDERQLEYYKEYKPQSTYLRRKMATSASSIPQVYYSDAFPIDITNMNDISCPEGESANCHLVKSKLTVFHKSSLDDDYVKAGILGGLRESFQNGDFDNALPN